MPESFHRRNCEYSSRGYRQSKRADCTFQCTQCAARGSACTSIYIEQLQQNAGQKKKRVITKRGEKHGDGLGDGVIAEQGYSGEWAKAPDNLAGFAPGESSRQGFW